MRTTPFLADRSGKQIDVVAVIERYGLLAFCAVLVLLTATVSPAFRSPTNLQNVLTNVAPLAIVVLGQSMVILVRGFDLSVSSVMATAAVIATQFEGAGGLGLSSHASGDAGHVARRGPGQRFPCDEARHVAISCDARDDDRASGLAFRLDARRPLRARSARASVDRRGPVFRGSGQSTRASRPHSNRLGRAREDAVRTQGLYGGRRPARCGTRGRKRRPHRDRLLRRQRSACGHWRAGARRLCQRRRQLGGSRLRARTRSSPR